MNDSFEPGRIVAISFIAGFAIQQFLQILDLVVAPLIGDRETIWKLPAQEFKKDVFYLIAFLCGLFIAYLLNIDVLALATKGGQHTVLGTVISGFVLGSGTEAANTFIKYFGYLKDAQKYSVEPEITVAVIPAVATLKVNETATFKGIVKNASNAQLSWQVLQGSGGTITDSGLYQAPSVAGEYTIIATSMADESKTATVKVTVK